jgi:CheY-like chemotaxis protein
LGELIRERRATITAKPLPEVNVAEQHMRQVLQNLVSNSIRHCTHPAVIDIDAAEQGEFWVVRVADNGVGVERDQQQKIFEPFIRQGPNPGQGLGMGLAICKRIVESHGGQIWCEPREGGGSLFCFSLPKLAAAETPADAPPTPAAEARAVAVDEEALARVLLVDDNEAAIELTRIVLIEGSKLRCQFVSANGGEEALALLTDAAQNNQSFDLVLLDINMPRMDGFEVLQRIRQNTATSKVAVVMCTTSSYDKDMERARTLGASGFVNKPATLKNLGPLFSDIETLRIQEVDGGRVLLRVA